MEQAKSGLFGIKEDHQEHYQSLDERFVKNKLSTFFFEAEGDAMSPLVLPGDVLVVDRSVSAHFGHLILAIYNEEILCRRLVREKGKIVLRADNPKVRSIELTGERDLVVWGVVRAIVHPLLERA